MHSMLRPLSVSREYLALPDGPGGFAQNYSCSALLRIPLSHIKLRLPDYHRLWCNFPDASTHSLCTMAWSYNPVYALPHMRFGLFPVRSPLLGESLNCFLFLQVLRCFSSLRLPGHLHLPEAYRSLSRPSSPPRAKASTRRPNLLSPIMNQSVSTYIFIAHTFSCNQLLRFSFT